MKLLFDLGPKDKREELFGRDEEISEMMRLITTGNWVVVLGPRMTGKTSLVKVVLDELRKKKEYDTIYLNLRGTKSIHELLNKLAESINANKNLDKLKNFISNIRSIHIGPDGL